MKLSLLLQVGYLCMEYTQLFAIICIIAYQDDNLMTEIIAFHPANAILMFDLNVFLIIQGWPLMREGRLERKARK
jgi:hypothetical protein